MKKGVASGTLPMQFCAECAPMPAEKRWIGKGACCVCGRYGFIWILTNSTK